MTASTAVIEEFFVFDPPGPDRPEPPRWAKVPAAVAHHRSLSDRAVHVFAVLARFAGRTGRCWPSRETVAGAAGVSVRSVGRALGELAAVGLIERTARGNGHGGRTSSVTTLTAGGGGGWAAVPEAALGCSSRAVRLVAVLDLMADRNGMVAASRGRLAELLACSTDSIDRALRELVAVGVVVRLPAAGKTGRLRLPHRPARPAAPVDSPAPATPAPSARVAVKVPHQRQGNESSLNENLTDTRGNSNRGPGRPAAAPRSSGSSSPSAARATAAWTRAACRTYAAAVAAGRTDLTNRYAFVGTVARQAAVERADRLAELHAAGLDPAAAAAALAADGPAPPPAAAPPRREPRPLGDPGCPVCEGDGWTPDLAGLMVRCACTAPDLDLEPAPPPVLEPGEVALDHDAALARIREIRRRRTVGAPSA